MSATREKDNLRDPDRDGVSTKDMPIEPGVCREARPGPRGTVTLRMVPCGTVRKNFGGALRQQPQTFSLTRTGGRS